jgi:hexokinase
VSGLYLGDVARLVLLEAHEHGLLFPALAPARLQAGQALSTEALSRIAADESASLDDVGAILRASFGADATLPERRFVRAVGGLVARRSARLAAVMVAAVLRQRDVRPGESASVAVDGSLFEKYPAYASQLSAALKELAGGASVILFLAKDGSGVGAALTSFLMGGK